MCPVCVSVQGRVCSTGCSEYLCVWLITAKTYATNLPCLYGCLTVQLSYVQMFMFVFLLCRCRRVVALPVTKASGVQSGGEDSQGIGTVMGYNPQGSKLCVSVWVARGVDAVLFPYLSHIQHACVYVLCHICSLCLRVPNLIQDDVIRSCCVADRQFPHHDMGPYGLLVRLIDM